MIEIVMMEPDPETFPSVAAARAARDLQVMFCGEGALLPAAAAELAGIAPDVAARRPVIVVEFCAGEIPGSPGAAGAFQWLDTQRTRADLYVAGPWPARKEDVPAWLSSLVTQRASDPDWIARHPHVATAEAGMPLTALQHDLLSVLLLHELAHAVADVTVGGLDLHGRRWRDALGRLRASFGLDVVACALRAAKALIGRRHPIALGLLDTFARLDDPDAAPILAARLSAHIDGLTPEMFAAPSFVPS